MSASQYTLSFVTFFWYRIPNLPTLPQFPGLADPKVINRYTVRGRGKRKEQLEEDTDSEQEIQQKHSTERNMMTDNELRVFYERIWRPSLLGVLANSPGAMEKVPPTLNAARVRLSGPHQRHAGFTQVLPQAEIADFVALLHEFAEPHAEYRDFYFYANGHNLKGYSTCDSAKEMQETIRDNLPHLVPLFSPPQDPPSSNFMTYIDVAVEFHPPFGVAALWRFDQLMDCVGPLARTSHEAGGSWDFVDLVSQLAGVAGIHGKASRFARSHLGIHKLMIYHNLKLMTYTQGSSKDLTVRLHSITCLSLKHSHFITDRA